MFSEISNTAPHKLSKFFNITQVRLIIFVAFPTGLLISMSQQVVNFLYDDRYSEVGWILGFLLIRMVTSLSVMPGLSLLLALGNSVYSAISSTVRVIILVGGMLIGFHFGGMTVMVLVAGIAGFFSWPVVLYGLHKLGYYKLMTDLLILALVGTGYLVGQFIVMNSLLT